MPDPIGANNPNQPVPPERYLIGDIDVTHQVTQARQRIFQNIQNIIGANQIGGAGYVLFPRLPGRVFQAGTNRYYYNSGTDDQGRYIPPMNIARNGNILSQGLLAFNQRPAYTRIRKQHYGWAAYAKHTSNMWCHIKKRSRYFE